MSISGNDKKKHLVEITGTTIQKDKEIKDLLIMHDLTSRKEYEKQLKERTKELENISEFAIGRELKMVELKKELNILLSQLNKKSKDSK